MDLLRELTTRVEAMARAVYRELLARVGLELGESALLLPDLIDVGRRVEFERKTVPELHEAVAQGRFRSLDGLFDWLRGEVGGMTPGADPLPALRSSLVYLARAWGNELGGVTVLADLATWADGRSGS
jgi:hypothetical protein